MNFVNERVDRMKQFREIAPEKISDNVFQEIGKEYMLLTAWDEAQGKVNAMTASWGAMGVLWNMPVLICVVRPQRYSLGLIEQAAHFSACILEREYRDAHKICGTKSGRDTDKCAEAGLTPVELEGVYGFEQAKRVYKLTRVASCDMKEADFIDRSLLSTYAAGDYHRVIICKIDKVFDAQS